MIKDQVIEQILASVNILDVIGQYLDIDKAGKNHIALCPFHNDKKPSLSISADKGLYHCFACGASGNAINFLMEYKNLSFIDALTELSLASGIDIEPSKSDIIHDNQEIRTKLMLYEVNQKAALFYHKYLKEARESADARAYLSGRGISRESIEDFTLGYGGRGWQLLLDTIKNDSSPENLIEADLAVQGEKGAYDRFHDRIIFPIQDEKGRFVGFGGRVFRADAVGAKYLNTSETPLFRKSYLLYGLYQAREELRLKRTAVIVEGYMDVVMLHQHGVKNSLAALGTSFGENHLKLLRRFCQEIYFVFDGDDAGQKAADRAVTVSVKSDLRQNIVILPEGMDPDDYCRKYSGDEFISFLKKNAVSPITFKLGYLKKTIDPAKDPVGFIAALLPYFESIPSMVLKDDALKETAIFLSRDIDIVRDEMSRLSRKARQTDRNDSMEILEDNKDSLDPMELELMALMTLMPEEVADIKDLVNEKMFTAPNSKALYQFILSHPGITSSELYNRIDHAPLIKRASILVNMESLSPLTLKEVACRFRLNFLKKYLAHNLSMIDKAEKKTDREERDRLLKKNLELTQARKETEKLLGELLKNIG